ncbi:MAG: hypothetical protein JOY69_06405, partial [Candidatus Eremiobacteraeota bacterium]|nr:hypothetical protein [Candidatus Eremiobacteraeota bacterium]
VNETPPGSALVFELHGSSGAAFVRTFFTAQTLDQMRSGDGGSPGRVPVYVPGCPGYDCPIDTFTKVVGGAIDTSFTGPW